MTPHRQWCYTPEKGTHWYAGSQEKFAPLYQFVRRHADLFDDYQAYADVGIVLPHRAFVKNSQRWFEICDQLSAANASYRLCLAGDEIVDHPLSADELGACRTLLIPDRENLSPADRQLVEQRAENGACFATVPKALAQVTLAVRPEPAGLVRALPRVKSGSAVIHLLNHQYDAARDDVQPVRDVKVLVDLVALGVAGSKTCRWITPDADPIVLPVDGGQVQVPGLGLWGLLVFGGAVRLR
jgi:hypothetical protein